MNDVPDHNVVASGSSNHPASKGGGQHGEESAFRLPGLRWWMMALIVLGSILNYLTRQTLSVAQVRLTDSLGISKEEYGLITGAFQLTLMLQPICGYVLDVIGLRIGLAIFVVAWSVISMAHGLATGWKGLAFLRGLMGFAEGSANPAGMKATAQWFPARERGLAGGIYNIGASAGMMLAGPLVLFAITYLNWQSAFVISGGLGLVWVCLWLFFFESPARHRWLSRQERDYIESGQEKSLESAGKPSMWAIIRQRNFWGIALPRFLADPTWIALGAWLPSYMKDERGWDLKAIAEFTWLPFLAADIGCIFGGVLAAKLQKHLGVSLINARRLAFTSGAVLMIGVAFAGMVEDPYVAILLFSLAGFAHQTLSVTVITMSSDLFRRSEVATVAGMAGTFGNAGALIFTLSVGVLVSHIGYSPFFVCLSILDIIGAIVLWTLVRERHELS
ncbi:MAG TPA: MFS transporter [Gemmataceae bacterium]|nr:MFS transporter [Gemmataceae bacterium]